MATVLSVRCRQRLGKGEIYSAATGVWTVTGTLSNVNAALAAISFVPVANGFANTSASVSISDGNRASHYRNADF